MNEQRPEIFNFLDYRDYIQDYCTWRKQVDGSFSMRAFAGTISPTLLTSGLLYAILKRKRKLSAAMRPKFVRAMHLKGREAQYFELLVQFNQSRDMEEKNHYFLQLSQFRSSRARIVSESQYKFFSCWYFPVVWTFFEMDQSLSNPVEIARRISPPISSKQVQEAISLLLELKLIKKMANGYAVTDNHMTTEKEFRGLIAKQYNLQFIQMAGDMLDKVDPSHRQYNTLVFSTSAQGFDILLERIIAFQEELQEIIGRIKPTDRIYTLSMQLYPNTKLSEK